MQQLFPSDLRTFRQVLGRLNRVVAELNVVLLAIAIGLAALDFTCGLTLRASAVIARAQAEAHIEASAAAFESAKPPIPEPFKAGFSGR